MERLSQDKINEIRGSVDIVDVIGQYLPLTKQGRNYKAICPFHNDTRPSLSISPDKQIYKCFVCDSGGNVFTFLQNHLKISYIEAVKKVAEIGRIDLSEYHLETKATPIKKEYVDLYSMNEEACKIYSYYLNTKLGLEAKAYLNQRHFNDELIEQFSIGYAPIETVLYQSFKQKGYNEIAMVNSGLIIESRNHYDRFNDRIMFPLHDSEGRIVGFSGRIYKMTQTDSKYMNSPESDIFIKGKTLYNYHRCKEAVRKEGFVYLLEGFMDVIAMYKAGIDNAVAIMGTSLTKEHIQLLRRLTNTIHICLDGDRAGQVAASKAAAALLEANMNVKIILLPDNHDPDEIYEEHGKLGLIELLKKTLSPIEFQMDFEYRHIDTENYEDRKKFLENMCQLINKIQDDLDKDYYIQRLSKLSGFSSTIIEQKLAGIKQVEIPVYREVKQVKRMIDKYHKAERDLLFYMLHSKEVAKKYEAKVGFMYDDRYRVIASYIVDYYRTHDKLVIADFINRFEKNELIQAVIDIVSLSLPLPYDEKAVNDYMKMISLNAKKMKKEQLLEQFNYVLDPYKKSEILKEIVDLEKE
ncbi:MAG: DNA primase [Bacilli bacterium]|nr:DNA primase [Bacilli bacterium]